MELESLIESAASSGASDLHLEAGMPAAMRIRGTLRITGEPIAPRALMEFARGLLGEEQWPVFLERRSFDCRGPFTASVAASIFSKRRAASDLPSGC